MEYIVFFLFLFVLPLIHLHLVVMPHAEFINLSLFNQVHYQYLFSIYVCVSISNLIAIEFQWLMANWNVWAYTIKPQKFSIFIKPHEIESTLHPFRSNINEYWLLHFFLCIFFYKTDKLESRTTAILLCYTYSILFTKQNINSEKFSQK